MKVTGAQALFKSLEGEGVDVMFGVPGGAILPAYDPLIDSSVRHVLCRHEQGAGHAAEGYAWATGKVGVVMATSGPGGCNLVTPLADAKMDSVPLVAITGQVPTPVVGNDAFQEADITGITMPVTKHNMLVTSPADVAEAVREAFHIARTGRPGPVLIDLPKDVLVGETTWKWPDSVKLPGYKPTTKGNQRQVVEAVKLIMKAKRPVLYVGRRRHQGRGHEGALQGGDDGRAPGRHDAHGARRLPRRARALPGDAGHARQLHGRHGHAEVRPADRRRRPVRRPRHRQARRLRAGREDRAHRHRPGRDRQEPRGRRADRRRLQGRPVQDAGRAHEAPGAPRAARPTARRGASSSPRGRRSTRTPTTSSPTGR